MPGGLTLLLISGAGLFDKTKQQRLMILF